MDLGCSARGYGQGDLATKVVLVATLDLTWQRDLATKVVLVTTLDLKVTRSASKGMWRLVDSTEQQSVNIYIYI